MAAIDCNGQHPCDVARLASLDDWHFAQGVENGRTRRSTVGWIRTSSIMSTHAMLLDALPGFGCFAVLTAK
jgi:hypothetical protein